MSKDHLSYAQVKGQVMVSKQLTITTEMAEMNKQLTTISESEVAELD